MTTLDLALLILLTLTSLWAVMAARLLYAAVALALASVVLALVMFRMASPLAAVIELSVCAGLITAIFISVISLVKHQTQAEIFERAKMRRGKYLLLPVLMIVIAALFFIFVKPYDFTLPRPLPEADVRNVFWHMRSADLLGQIIMLLVGAFGIVVLFKDRKTK